MSDILVVADDLTGANAAAAGFARCGFRVVTATAAEDPGVVAEMASRFDVVVATIDSRHVDAATARDRTEAVVAAGWPSRLVCNRIDTTLRGNIGATTRAVLELVSARTGSRCVVLCAPAHPSAGRQTVGGVQLLDGRRLEETEVAYDARTPVKSSDIVALLQEQADLAVAAIPLGSVTGDPSALVDEIRRAIADGADVVVADATTEEHLDRIGIAAVAAAEGTGIVWAASDPGPASVALARALRLDSRAPGAPLLAVSGSATELTRTQLRQLSYERSAQVYRTVGDGAVPDVAATTKVLNAAIEEAGPGDIVVLATALEQADLCRPTAQEAREIPRALARAVRRSLEIHCVDGLFTTGGDVTAAMLDELGSHGLEVSDEVVPLAVAGSLISGPWDALDIVTKGGLIGDANTTIACLDHLRRAADLKRRRVSPVESREPH